MFRDKVLKALTGDNRKDITVSDAQKIKGGQYKLAFSFNTKIGSPTYRQLNNVFASHIPELTLIPASASIIGNTIIVMANVNTETKPLSEKKTMKEVVANISFLDQDMGNYWNIKEVEGSKVLQKVVNLDVQQLINERRKRMGDPVTACVSIIASVHNLGAGDTVKVYHNYKSKIGKVKSMKNNDIVFDGPDGVETFDKDYVLQIVQHSVEKNKQDKQTAEDYFSQLYGDKFAKGMSK